MLLTARVAALRERVFVRPVPRASDVPEALEEGAEDGLAENQRNRDLHDQYGEGRGPAAALHADVRVARDLGVVEVPAVDGVDERERLEHVLEQRGLRARVAVEALPIPPELHVRIVRVWSCILIDAPVVEPLEEVRARPFLPVDLREVVGVVRFEPHVPLRLEQRPLLPQEGRLAPQHARRRVGHAHIERGPAEFDAPRRSDDVDELLLVLPRFRRAQVELTSRSSSGCTARSFASASSVLRNSKMARICNCTKSSLLMS